jgi:hypothetical protein
VDGCGVKEERGHAVEHLLALALRTRDGAFAVPRGALSNAQECPVKKMRRGIKMSIRLQIFY